MPGHLLVVHLAKNYCYQVDPKTGESTFLFSLNWGATRTFFWRAIADVDGSIYCSVSGAVVGLNPPRAKFHYWGAVAKINHRLGSITKLAETQIPGQGVVLDPHGMQLLEGNRLLVCDFQGFKKEGEHGGAVYLIDRTSGALQVLARSGFFNVPVNALLDSDGILWVASADMTEQNDGEVIRVDKNGKQEVFLPSPGKNSGQVVGILQSYKPEELIIFRCEWPNVRGNSAVFALNKKTAEKRMFFQSSPDDPRFYNTNGDVSGKILWFAESVRKQLIGFDLEREKIIAEIDLGPVVGEARGMIDSYDGLESVTVVPTNVRNTEFD
jgi:hypothetical protein